MSKNETSVYTDKVKDAIESIPQELYSLSEDTLRHRVKPTIKLYEVKRAFWEELLMAQEEKRGMRNWRVYDGKVSKAYFYEKILRDPQKMAWITSPLDSYEDKSKAALDMVSQRYEDLISIDIMTTKKRKVGDEWEEYREVCPKKAMVLLQVIKNLEDRIKGTAIQRQVNVHTREPENKKARLDMSEVEKKLIELEQKLGEGNAVSEKHDNKIRVLREDDSSDKRENNRDGESYSIPTSSRLVEPDKLK
jgi:hypothetical protein